MFVLFELLRLGVPAADDGVRQAGQLCGVEPVGLGAGTVYQLVEERDGLLGDVLVALVLHHAGHVGGEHAVHLLRGEVVVVGREQGAATALSKGAYNGAGDSCTV